jgi:hypothetical protein
LYDHPQLLSIEKIDLYNNLSEVASLVDECDMVISIDNYLAHLAGRIGKPLLLLLSKAHDWRWFLNTPVNPWYPQAKIFTQQVYSQWEEVFARLTVFLQEQLVNV